MWKFISTSCPALVLVAPGVFYFDDITIGFSDMIKIKRMVFYVYIKKTME